jgi:hypothetical protein
MDEFLAIDKAEAVASLMQVSNEIFKRLYSQLLIIGTYKLCKTHNNGTYGEPMKYLFENVIKLTILFCSSPDIFLS